MSNYKKLKQVPTGVWYSVINKSGENMKMEIMELIDAGDHFQISSDTTRFKRLFDPVFIAASETKS